MTLTPEQLKALSDSFTQARLNASTPAERESAEMMCEVVRLAEIGMELEFSDIPDDAADLDLVRFRGDVD